MDLDLEQRCWNVWSGCEPSDTCTCMEGEEVLVPQPSTTKLQDALDQRRCSWNQQVEEHPRPRYMRVATIMASPIHLAKEEKGHVQHVQGLGLKLLVRVHTCFTSSFPPPSPPPPALPSRALLLPPQPPPTFLFLLLRRLTLFGTSTSSHRRQGPQLFSFSPHTLFFLAHRFISIARFPPPNPSPLLPCATAPTEATLSDCIVTITIFIPTFLPLSDTRGPPVFEPFVILIDYSRQISLSLSPLFLAPRASRHHHHHHPTFLTIQSATTTTAIQDGVHQRFLLPLSREVCPPQGQEGVCHHQL